MANNVIAVLDAILAHVKAMRDNPPELPDGNVAAYNNGLDEVIRLLTLIRAFQRTEQ